LEENLDLAIRIGILPDSSLIASRVGSTRHVVCASPGYLATRGRLRKPDDLTAHECITFEGLASPQGWAFRSGNDLGTVPVRARLAVTTAEAAIDAAIAGVGVTRVLSYMIDDARRAGLLDIVLEAFEPPPWPIQLVHQGQGALPLKRRVFLDWMVPRLRARLR
jgi:DNA-binding transcriptional LysR family regulator